MSTRTFGEQFMDSRGAPIRYRGQEVHAYYRLPVTNRVVVRVRFVSVNPQVRQALRFTVAGGNLVVNGQALSNVVLWSDTAPRVSEIEIVPSTTNCTVKVWNAWEDESGVMQAWIGNGGMLVDVSPSGVRLQCSDGVGGPSFGDLVAELVVG